MDVAELTGDRGTATLDISGKWSSDREDLAHMLNALFDRAMYPSSPSEHTPGQKQVEAAVSKLGMKAKWLVSFEHKPGVIY